MIQVTAHTRVLVAVDSVDFRGGIDRLGRVCREVWPMMLGRSRDE
jgi:hypothetical protein